MKRTIAILLCALISVFACSCTQQETSSPINPPETNQQDAESSESQNSSAQSETNTESKPMKLSVNLPNGWEAVEGSILPAHYMKNDSAVFMVMQQGYTGNTIDDVVEMAKDANSKTYDSIAYQGNTESIKVDGKDARKFVFTYSFGGLSMKSMTVYLFYEQDTYAIIFTDFAESFDTLTEDYEAILAQIKFE